MQPIHILLLDDSHEDMLIARKALRRESIINTLHCFDAETEALNFLKHNPIDMVMVDINIGIRNGLDFIKGAREQGLLEGKAVVVVSGVEDPTIVAQADLLGVSTWIDKPLDAKKFYWLASHIPDLCMAMVRVE